MAAVSIDPTPSKGLLDDYAKKLAYFTHVATAVSYTHKNIYLKDQKRPNK